MKLNNFLQVEQEVMISQMPDFVFQYKCSFYLVPLLHSYFGKTQKNFLFLESGFTELLAKLIEQYS